MRNVIFLILPLFFFLLLTGHPAPLGAANPFTPDVADKIPEAWRWAKIPQLQNLEPRCINQDADGNMWFGVNEGVMRYDGYVWKEYRKPEEFADYAITTIEFGKDGLVYVGTDKGLLVISDNRWRKIFPFTETEHAVISDIVLLPDGSVLVGLSANNSPKNIAGLLRLRNDEMLLYASAATLADLSETDRARLKLETVDNSLTVALRDGRRVMSVQDLLLSSGERIYAAISEVETIGKIAVFGYDRGISKELSLREVISKDDGLLIRDEVNMAETSSGELWVVSRAHELGVYHFNGKQWESVLLSNIFGGVNSQSSVMVCSDGTVWVDGNGRLFRFKDGQWTLYEYPKVKISTASRFSFYEAADKSVWVLGFMNEVYRFDNTFNTWATYNDLNFQLETEDGTAWFVGARNTIVSSRFGKWNEYGPMDGLMDTPVRVFATSYGEVWAVGSHQGVAATAYLTNDGWQMKRHPRVSWGIDYRAVFEDHTGTLWFGCGVDIKKDAGHLGGVLELKDPRNNKTKWTHHNPKRGNFIYNCYGIGQSKDGRLWFGGKQLWTYDGKEWAVPNEIDWSGDYIDVIKNAPDGNLWMGSRHQGIAVYDGETWTRYTIDNGLPSNNIISIDVNGPDNVWVMTFGGICHFDGERWTSNLFPESLIPSPKSTRIKRGGTGFLWFNYSSVNWRLRGQTWPNTHPSVYGGYRTVVYNKDENPPRTHIITAPGKVEQAGNLTVFWSGNDYFEQTAAEELQYSYRLNDQAWSDFSPAEYQRFEGLPAGAYSLEVRARDRDFNIDPLPAMREFSVMTPWWWRPQFLIIVSIAALIIGTLQYLVLRNYRNLKVLNVKLEDKSRLLGQRNDQIREQKVKLEHSLTEIQEASKSRLRFFTNVSHEFRTPLSLIIGPIDELMDSVVPISDETRDKYYSIIRRNGQRILRLINQILEIYKVEDSTLEYRPVYADLAEYIREITSQFAPLADQRGVHLETNCTHPKLLTYFDQDKVEKVLFNLLSNAFKNVPANGTVRVELKLTEVEEKGAAAGAKKVEITVTDDGQGIPAASLTKVFDRFYQVKESDAANLHLGTGIGLSYISELVKTHGGTISVESEPGVMTSFTVVLPYTYPKDNRLVEASIEEETTHPSAEMRYALEELRRSLYPLWESTEEARRKPTEDVDHHQFKLLLVEDDLDTRIFLRTCFEARCEVIEATNGQEGLALAKSEYPDLIISDVTMPKMDGIDFCTALKNDFDTSHIPVILLTARTLEEEKIRGFQVGADAYIEKPFSYRVLESRVSSLIRSRENLRLHFQGNGEVSTSGVQIASVDEQFLQRAIEVVEQEIDNSNLDAQELSRKLGVSRIQLYRKLKALTGQTVNKFVRSVRLKHASRLLLEQNLTISEIAYQTGFVAPNHFSTYFKEHYGVSPSEYQRKHG